MAKKDYKTQVTWQKQKTKLFTVRLSKVQEEDMVEWIDNIGEPFGQYVRRLIRADMEAHGVTTEKEAE